MMLFPDQKIFLFQRCAAMPLSGEIVRRGFFDKLARLRARPKGGEHRCGIAARFLRRFPFEILPPLKRRAKLFLRFAFFSSTPDAHKI